MAIITDYSKLSKLGRFLTPDYLYPESKVNTPHGIGVVHGIETCGGYGGRILIIHKEYPINLPKGMFKNNIVAYTTHEIKKLQ